MQLFINFSWELSKDPSVVSQTLQVVDDTNAVVSHQVLGAQVTTIQVALDFSKVYTASLVASNQYLSSVPAELKFSTPDAPKAPDAPTNLTETVTIQ